MCSEESIKTQLETEGTETSLRILLLFNEFWFFFSYTFLQISFYYV